MCDNCIHKPVCSIYEATGGVKRCKHYREGRKGKVIGLLAVDEKPLHMNGKCPFCQAIMMISDRFCPMCSADMRGEEYGR